MAFIKDGDMISISYTDLLKKGDIITVKNSYDRILTHRIIDEKKLITKGDNNVYPEKPLLGKSFQLLGRLDYVVRNGKKIDVNKYNSFFYKYSHFEAKTYSLIKKIIPINSIIYVLKKITYPAIIFFLKIRYGRNY